MRPDPATVQDTDTDSPVTELTEVTLALTDDVADHQERRELTQEQLADLLLAFDDCEEDPEGAYGQVEVSLEYKPAEYGGRCWNETRTFASEEAAAVLAAFEAGHLV
ncbi:hypothetical protein ABT093_36925 [Kitasatospora sp. NPDC002551]|uniref:hypothetical protein n=1 Tax=Kitasatospora sp. NPDC002551 TaxID=3154539 RepID=UPI003326702F